MNTLSIADFFADVKWGESISSKKVGTLPVNGSDEQKRTNEIKTVAPMLDAFDIAGRTITADALHTQRAFAEYLVRRGAHYHLTAKENQPTLLDDVRLWFESPGEPDHEQIELGHGRIESRRIWVTSKLNEYLAFPHVGQAFRVERTVEYKNGRRKGWREYAYGITSLSAEQADAEQLLKDNRGHWSIESVHYMLDWDFDEDRSRIRTGHGPENMTRLRRFAIGVLKSKQKRYETVREQMLRLNRMPRVVLDYLKLTGNTALRSAAPTATPPRL